MPKLLNKTCILIKHRNFINKKDFSFGEAFSILNKILLLFLACFEREDDLHVLANAA